MLSRRRAYLVLWVVKRLIKPPRLVRKKDKMHERVGVDGEEQYGSHKEEGGQGKLNV